MFKKAIHAFILSHLDYLLNNLVSIKSQSLTFSSFKTPHHSHPRYPMPATW